MYVAVHKHVYSFLVILKGLLSSRTGVRNASFPASSLLEVWHQISNTDFMSVLCYFVGRCS